MWIFVQAEEEARSLQKKIQQIENDLDQTMEQLMQVNAKLDEKDKALQNVSHMHFVSPVITDRLDAALCCCCRVYADRVRHVYELLPPMGVSFIPHLKMR
jgi:hypothetical protein